MDKSRYSLHFVIKAQFSLKDKKIELILFLFTVNLKLSQARKFKKIYFIWLFDSCKKVCKKTWNITDNLLNNKLKTLNSYSIIYENIVVNNNNDISNLFNRYFVSIGRTPSSGIVHNEYWSPPLLAWEIGVHIIFSSAE